MESPRDQCRKEGCEGCSNCMDGFLSIDNRGKLETMKLADYTVEQLQAEISKRKLDRKAEAARRVIQSEIKDLQKKIYALQQKLSKM